MCATCHNTAVFKNYQESDDTYHTEMAEEGIGCESCHGPMKEHVVWRRKNPTATTKDPTVRQPSRDQIMSNCASCHARRSELTGEFTTGDSFFDHFSIALPDENNTFYPDGQVWDEDFEYSAFLGSRMHAIGVTCLHCHDQHSGKTRLEGNALCMQCHQDKIDPVLHSHHKSGSAGEQCINCHMPQTPYMQLHWRHDHGFTIPDPALTKEHGIPNACNRCHKDQSNDWAIKQTEKWYPTLTKRHTQRRARLFARAKSGDSSCIPELIHAALTEENPYWKSVAIEFLKNWRNQPEVIACLQKCSQDESPLVRHRAALGLGGIGTPQTEKTLSRLWEDPVRSIRVQAALSSSRLPPPTSTASIDLEKFLKHNADQPIGAYQQGIFSMKKGNIDQAIGYFQKAIEWDPNSAALHHALAMALNSKGLGDAVIKGLKEAVRLEPRNAGYLYDLALAQAEIGETQEAIESLNKAVQLDPQLSQALYNLGLLYSKTGKPEVSLNVLNKALQLDPQNTDYRYARATVMVQLKRTREAKEEIQKVLGINPSHQNALELQRFLSKSPP